MTVVTPKRRGGAGGVLELVGGALADALGVAVAPDVGRDDALVARVDRIADRLARRGGCRSPRRSGRGSRAARAARGSSSRRRARRRRRSGRPSRRARGRRSPRRRPSRRASVSGRSAHWPVNSVTGRAIEARRIWRGHIVRVMRIAIAGGGPGGLYLSILLKRLDPAHEVVVHERNAPDDTFGFGVVFSDETLAAFEAADPESYAEITRALRALERDRRPLPRRGDHQRRARVLRARAQAAAQHPADAGGGARASTCASASEVSELEGDLVVAADGVNSTLRARRASGPTLDRRRATYAWFGTAHVFDAFTFLIAETAARRRAGPRLSLQRHDEHVHRRDDGRRCRSTRRPARRCSATAGREPHALDQLRHRPQRALARRERRAARRRRAHRALLDRLAAPSSRWRTRSRSPGRCARATSTPTRPSGGRSWRARSARRRARSSGSRASGATCSQDPRTFAFNLLTRSRRITHGELRMRDPDFVADAGRRRRRCSRRSGCAGSSWPTASWSRRWTCTPRSTARRATSTSCTSARGRSAAPGW